MMGLLAGFVGFLLLLLALDLGVFRRLAQVVTVQESLGEFVGPRRGIRRDRGPRCWGFA